MIFLNMIIMKKNVWLRDLQDKFNQNFLLSKIFKSSFDFCYFILGKIVKHIIAHKELNFTGSIM